MAGGGKANKKGAENSCQWACEPRDLGRKRGSEDGKIKIRVFREGRIRKKKGGVWTSFGTSAEKFLGKESRIATDPEHPGLSRRADAGKG